MHLLVYGTLADRPLVIGAVLVAWFSAGLIVAAFLGRRGHSFRQLVVLGLAFGPLLLGYVVSTLRFREDEMQPVVLRAPAPLGGDQRIVVAVFGEPEQVADALGVLQMTGDRLGEVEVVAPISFEAADLSIADAEREAAVEWVQQAALFLEDHRPGLVLLPGAGVDAVCRYLDERPADVVVVAGDPDAQVELCRNRDRRAVTVMLGRRAGASG